MMAHACPMARRVLFAMLLLPATGVAPAAAAEPSAPPMELAREKRALRAVVVGPGSSDPVKGTAADLAQVLSRLSGATFTVQAGDGSSGIVIGRPAEFAQLPFKVEFGTSPFQREETATACGRGCSASRPR